MPVQVWSGFVLTQVPGSVSMPSCADGEPPPAKSSNGKKKKKKAVKIKKEKKG